MADIPNFVKEGGKDFNYEKQVDRAPPESSSQANGRAGGSNGISASSKGKGTGKKSEPKPTCRILKRSMANQIFFVDLYWPYGDASLTTSRIEVCNAWIQLRNETMRLRAILSACEEVNGRSMFRKDCSNDQVKEIRKMFDSVCWTFDEINLFAKLLEKYESHARLPHWLLPVPPQHSVLDLKTSPFRLKPRTLANELSTLPLVIVHQLNSIVGFARAMPGWYSEIKLYFTEDWSEPVPLEKVETAWSRWVDDQQREQQRLAQEARMRPTVSNGSMNGKKKNSFLGFKMKPRSKRSSSSSDSDSDAKPPPYSRFG